MLVMSLVIITTTSTFATEKPLSSTVIDNTIINTLEDNDDYRLVESIKDGQIVTYKFDKINKSLTIENQETKERQVIDLSNIQAGQSRPILGASQIEGENTWSNFEFARYSDKKWEIRRPDPDHPVSTTKYFEINETTATYNILRSYRSIVYKINSKEGECIAATSVDFIAICLTTFLAGFTGGIGGVAAGALFSSLGLTGVALIKYCELAELCNNAYGLYWDIYDYK